MVVAMNTNKINRVKDEGEIMILVLESYKTPSSNFVDSLFASLKSMDGSEWNRIGWGSFFKNLLYSPFIS